MQQINDLFTTLMGSSQKFVVNGIQSECNKKVFTDEMQKIASMIYQYPNTFELREQLDRNRTYVLVEEKFPFSFSTNYQKYKLLAYNNSIDILDSLHRRFVTGGESDYCLIKWGKALYVA